MEKIINQDKRKLGTHLKLVLVFLRIIDAFPVNDLINSPFHQCSVNTLHTSFPEIGQDIVSTNQLRRISPNRGEVNERNRNF